jgi:uncharacterized protein (DUF2147 family)
MISKRWFYSISPHDSLTGAYSPARLVQSTFFLGALLFAPLALSGDISGFWKLATGPVWIEVRLEEGGGTVVRNDKFSDRVGRKVLKNLEADESKQGLWHGLIYAEKLGEYKDVEVSLPEADRMLLKGKVGFMSRTVEWVRVDKIPAH